MNSRTLWMVALGLGMLVPSMSFAQDQPGGRGGRGGYDPARFLEERLTRMKEELGAKDDEWQVLKPRIEKVMTAQFSAIAGRMGGMRGGRGGGDRGGDQGGNRGGDSQRPTSPAAQAQRDLREALQNKETSADQIVAKLTALRDARTKAKAELETAQRELKEVLSPRQEAVLVESGTLD